MDNPLLSFLQLFRSIPGEEQAIIAAEFQPRVYKEGDTILRCNTTCREMHFICKGIFKIVTINEKGNEVTHFFLKENQFCTILDSFNNDTLTQEGIEAACKAEVLSISKARLMNLYRQLPWLKELINQITQQALLDKIQVRNSYLGQDSTTRYKLFLIRQGDVALRVALSDIASYLGITQQSLSRIRRNIR